MRFLLFSDLHLHSWKYGSTVSEGWNSRLERQAAVVRGMFEYAARKGIRLILFSGDWYHTPSRVATEVLATAARIKEALPQDIHLIAIPGNHDIKTKGLESLSVMNSSNFHVISSEKHFSTKEFLPNAEDELHLSVLPYTEDSQVLQQFFEKVGSSKEKRFVLLHQGVSSVELNSKGFTLNELLKPDMIPSNVVQAFSGHYHSFKRVSDKLTIPGSLMQHTWADKGENRGFLDVTWTGSSMHMQHINTALRRPTVPATRSTAPEFIEFTVGESVVDARSRLQAAGWRPSWNNGSVLEDKIRGNIVRIISSSPVLESYRKKLMDMGPASLEIVYDEQSTEDKYDVDSKSSFESLTELFEDYVTRYKLDDDLVATGRQIINV